jgi:hypothetical protein
VPGKGRADGGNSGRQPVPPAYEDTGPVRLLRQLVRDTNAPRRERATSARALILHQARLKRAKSKQALAREALGEVGWLTGWHVGYDDGTPPSDPLYGVNLLQPHAAPRDPQPPKP